MLLPALSKARAAAQNIKCTSNVKQMCLGAFIYANENDDYLPGGWQGGNTWSTSGAWNPTSGDVYAWWAEGLHHNWMYGVWKAGIDKSVFRCPGKSDGTTTGDANFANKDYMVGYTTPSRMWCQPLGGLKRASEQVMVLDSAIQMSYYACVPSPGWTPADFGLAFVGKDQHGSRCNLGFADGHAESVKGSTITNSADMFTNE